MNCFELCIFEKLNTTLPMVGTGIGWLWIALNYVSLKSWIQRHCCIGVTSAVVNCFELCIFEKLNTTQYKQYVDSCWLWIALNYVSLKSWIQLTDFSTFNHLSCELLWIMYLWKVEYNLVKPQHKFLLLWIALNYVSLKSWIQQMW